MNALVRISESQPRHKWTWDEVLKMAQAGLFERNDGWRVELIDGELIDVSPQTLPHVRVKRWLIRLFIENLSGDDWHVVPESPLLPQERSGPEPDLYIYPTSVPDDALDGRSVALVIEVSVTSLELDTKRKRHLYADLLVREYWVFDVNDRSVIVHRNPSGGDYRIVMRVAADESLQSATLPMSPIALSDAPW